MLNRSPIRTLLMLWLAWAVIIVAYPTVAGWRYLPYRPDQALEWTPGETARNSQNGKRYLTDDFMNTQVSWDSEYYLSIAVGGYDDPAMEPVQVGNGQEYTKNYAFFPFYPLMIRVVSVPLSVLGMTDVATATLAGVMISLFGALAAILALYELVKDELGEDGGLRTVFYLLIFPTAFFFATVFTEGLFLGLVLWCLLMLKREQFVIAAILAAVATFTRATGVFLIIPLAVAWIQSVGWRNIFVFSTWNRQTIVRLLCILAPVAAHIVWRLALGEPFTLIEDNWFGRSLTNFERTYQGWKTAVEALLYGEVVQRRIYYALEFSAVTLALVASLFALRKYPGMALFCLAALAAGALTGAPQSLVRYVLTLPVIFVFLGRLGKYTLFDRAWTLTSILLLAMQVYLFSQDMWVA